MIAYDSPYLLEYSTNLIWRIDFSRRSDTWMSICYVVRLGWTKIEAETHRVAFLRMDWSRRWYLGDKDIYVADISWRFRLTCIWHVLFLIDDKDRYRWQRANTSESSRTRLELRRVSHRLRENRIAAVAGIGITKHYIATLLVNATVNHEL